MKKSILLILLAAIMVGSWGCGKQKLHDNKNFWVTVQERGTGKPIPNAEVVALEWVSTGILMGGDYNRLGVFTTDQNGRTFIDGGEREVSQLRIRTGLDYYDMNQGDIGITYVNRAFVESDPKIVELIPFAWLKLSIDFSIYQGEFDYVSFQMSGLCGGSIGAGMRVTEACQTHGNAIKSIAFFGFKDGKQVKTWQNEVYVVGHDTVTHVATYTP